MVEKEQEKPASEQPASEQSQVKWGTELMASVVVFLVALPLCMGIAISSGVPPALGLISGIVGGVLVGLIAGAPLQVSGPAAGLAVIVWELVQRFGLPALGIIVFLAGVFQLSAGLARMGRFFRAVSPAVIHALMAGIGILIFASQFHVMVDDKPRKNGIYNLLSIPESIYKGLFSGTSQHQSAAMIGILTITVIILWGAFKPKKLQFFPGPFVGAFVAAAVAGWFVLPINFIQIPTSLFQSANYPTSSAFALFLDPRIWGAAFAMALVASAETLLSVAATDRMHMGPRADYDRELTAQGLGNIICGGFGALPITGVIVRSSANVQAGATTRWSAIFHGLWLLLLVLFFPVILRSIPTSALAAVLVMTGYKLINIANIRNLWKTSRSEFGIYAVTVALIVGVDLLTGVIVGVVLSLVKLVYTFTNLEIAIQREPDSNEVQIQLRGAATFVRLPALAAELEALPLNSIAHLHMENLAYIDHACLELFDNWGKQLEDSGGELHIEWALLKGKFHRNPYREMPTPEEAEAELSSAPEPNPAK